MRLNNLHPSFMKSALFMARQGLGRTWPNPSVGCVIVKSGHVIARARTADGGRPHAETIALARAGEAAKGADMYVSLEPCAHHGRTPPCVDAIIQAGIGRVIIGCRDAAAHVNGKGVEALQKAGIEVIEGICEEQARALNQGFFLAQAKKRPFITLKIASTLDSKIASAGGESKWITGEQARRYAHLERSRHDAIAIGSGTLLTDDPSLTTRLQGVDHDPVRIVFDTHLKTPKDAKVFENISTAPLWIICGEGADDVKADQLTDQGARIIRAQIENEHLHLRSALNTLSENGITRLLVEGGASLISAFLRQGLYERILWFRSSSVMGASGRHAVDNLNIDHLDDMLRLTRKEVKPLGSDILEIFEKSS